MFSIFKALVLVQLAFGHGENKQGPHKGFIRMPGAYHTEVVPQKSKTFKVYLLDINWKNPIVKNSQVEYELLNGDLKHKASCQVQSNYFICELKTGLSLSEGQLTLQTIRDGQKGAEATYDLPLQLSKNSDSTKNPSPHKGHH